MDTTDLNLLRVFAAVFAHRHVGNAAVSLGMSQPGLSYALKRLRRHFADPLFVRTRTGMAPTEMAERIAPTIARMLDDVREHLVPTPAFDPRTSTRTFTLMMSDLGELIILPKLLRALASEAPGVGIRIHPVVIKELAATMQGGQIDLAIGYLPEPQGNDLFQQRLYSHGFVCVARKGHPRIGKVIDRETFRSLPHVNIRSTGRSHDFIEGFYAKHGVTRRALLQTPSILSVPFVVAATDLIATVPVALGELFSGMARIQTFEPPAPLPKITVRQCWHRRQHTNPANRWLRELVNRLFSGEKGWRLD